MDYPNPAEKISLIRKILPSLYKRLERCSLCPRNCGVNRLKDKKGFCKAGKTIVVYASFKHFGEEPILVGKGGSGTIFFSGCNLQCIYCQNYRFSAEINGFTLTEEDLAQIMLKLQKNGAQNINLVTPTHFLPQILKSLCIAFENGLNIPIVYNSSSFDNPELIEQIIPIMDTFLMDLKYTEAQLASKYSHANQYPQIAKENILLINKSINKKKYKGNLPKLIIRHLILPNHLKESIKVLKWLQENAKNAVLSIMSQYIPCYKSSKYPLINRKITLEEYRQIKAFVEENISLDGWLQEFSPDTQLKGENFPSQIDS